MAVRSHAWRAAGAAHLPKFGADLVSTLPRLDVHDLTHGDRPPARGCKKPGVLSGAGCKWKRFEE